MSSGNCHQWCECPKCTTFYDACMNEIPNPHTGSFSDSSERRIKALESQLAEMKKDLDKFTNWIEANVENNKAISEEATICRLKYNLEGEK